MTRVGAAQKTQLEQLGLHVIDASRGGLGRRQPRPVPVQRPDPAGHPCTPSTARPAPEGATAYTVHGAGLGTANAFA